MKRVFLIVLDSCGIGEMPDASEFKDKDCNTLKRISKSKYFTSNTMCRLGLGLIDGVDYIEGCQNPIAAYGRLTEKSKGKDTTIGHWEIAGVVSNQALPTYPNGFPKEILDEFSKRTKRGVLCNQPYSGTQVIDDYGEQHIASGDLIVYTSADSVFQIAAHEAVVPIEQLYEYCRIAREILCKEHAVGRVIARPFAGEAPNFYRTANRHDFSLKPPKNTLLDYIVNAGKTVYAVGKINDIFAGKGVSEFVYTHSNAEGMQRAMEALDKSFEGLCFVNLVDFDMLYGHRQDIDGYAKAFSEFDKWLEGFIAKMCDDDVLIITADHGCDPGDDSTDHSREYTPLLMYGHKIAPKNFKTRDTFADIAATIADYLSVPYCGEGKSLM